MKTSKKERLKEDHLAPTEIKHYNKLDKVKSEKYLSDNQVQQRLDLYSKGSQEQFFKVQKVKRRYIEKIHKQEMKRSREDLHYAQGIRAGLPHTDHDNIKNVRELQDQDFRDEIIKEAKTEYKNHENLTKFFDKESTSKGINSSINTSQKKAKVYDELGKLMGEFKAVQNVKNKAVADLKRLKSGHINQNDSKDLELDGESVKKEQNSLNKYFNTYKPTAKEVRKTFENIKRMDREL